MPECTSNPTFTVVRVWDRATRCFHWLNAVFVVGLVGIGTVMTFGDDLGLGDDTRALLTTSHTWLGYLFALNLVWRLAWMVRGSRRSAPTVGRTLLARAAVVIIYSVLILQATTGIFIALYIAVDLPFRTLYAIVAEAHYSNYLAILMLIVLHPVAVIVTAMINGKKFMRIASSEN